MTANVEPDLTGFCAMDVLVGVMILASMSDEVIRTSELVMIEHLIDHSPAFAEYDVLNVRDVSRTLEALMINEDGLDKFFGLLKAVLPDKLYETAYVLACDVVASDGKLEQPELRFLEELAAHLALDPLHVAAIEWATKVRYVKA
jgi:tellurite resistance protein